MSDDISDDQDATTTTIMIDEVNREIEEQNRQLPLEIVRSMSLE